MLCFLILALSSCGGNKRLYETVCGHYADAGISELDINDDGSFVSDTGVQKISGQWERGSGKVTVKDGSFDYDGIPLMFAYSNSSGSECHSEAVCYVDESGATKIQYSGVTYTRK